VYTEEWNFAKEERAVETIKEAVRGIRNSRTGMNVPPSRKAKVYVVSEDKDVISIFENGKVFFTTLAYASEVEIQTDKTGIADDAVAVLIPNATVYMPFADLVDIEKEVERLLAEQKKLEGEINRANGMLNNEKFTSKAPEAKIQEERDKLAKYTTMLEQVKERLTQLGR
jgi:valyl-tRNA synthetase